jgi:hypothetical protein
MLCERDALVAADELLALQLLVEHVELALELHGEAVDAVLNLDGRIGEEVAETTAEVRGAKGRNV